MDPDFAYGDMVAALEAGNKAEAKECAIALIGWLSRGGFLPPAADTLGFTRKSLEYHLKVLVDLID